MDTHQTTILASEHNETLQRILRSNAWFTTVLHAARAVDLPDWFVGSGVIRNIVWDYLHGYAVPTLLADVDFVFFDPQDLTPARDALTEAQLRAQMPSIPWQAKNQAAVHLWYADVFGSAVEPLASSEDAVGTWPETATSIGVRLLPDDTLLVAAPHGLDDVAAPHGLDDLLQHGPAAQPATCDGRSVPPASTEQEDW
jgi:uncharacterized protein